MIKDAGLTVNVKESDKWMLVNSCVKMSDKWMLVISCVQMSDKDAG